MRATGEFVTGPTYDFIVSFNTSCSSESSAVTSGDSSGDDLSQGAVAGTRRRLSNLQHRCLSGASPCSMHEADPGDATDV